MCRVPRRWQVRTICAVLEVLYAGHVRIRPKVLEVLTSLQGREGNRADIAAFLYFFEEHVSARDACPRPQTPKPSAPGLLPTLCAHS